MKALATVIAAVIGIFLLISVVALVAAVPIWVLWNWLCPELFHLPAITFWQALGLSALSGCLFRSTSSSSSSK